jgi:hypothetical protein
VASAALACAAVIISLSFSAMTNKAAADNSSLAQAGLPAESASSPVHANSADKSSGVMGNSLGTGSFTTFYTFQGNGVFPALRFNHGSINPNSRVFVTASEYSTDPTNRFIGQAKISVANIAPFNGGFLAWIDISWGSPINVRFDVFVDP